MADSPIVSNDAKERVALELLKIIAVAEKDQSKDRAYYLQIHARVRQGYGGAGRPDGIGRGVEKGSRRLNRYRGGVGQG